MANKTGQPTNEAHQIFLQDIQSNIRRILSDKYKMKKISIEYIAADAARLSNPIKITGENEKGETVRYFSKVIGSNDILSVRYIQFLKNIYLTDEHTTTNLRDVRDDRGYGPGSI
jgi:hypothetical protein